MADMDELGGSPNTAGASHMGRKSPIDAASGGGVTSVVESAASEQNIRDKAASGQVIGMDDINNPRRYLGHFAGDSVAAEGHNTGAPGKHAIKRVGGDIAEKGFKKIEGNHSTPVCTQAMKDKRAADDATFWKGMGMKAPKPVEMPKQSAMPLRDAKRERAKRGK